MQGPRVSSRCIRLLVMERYGTIGRRIRSEWINRVRSRPDDARKADKVVPAILINGVRVCGYRDSMDHAGAAEPLARASHSNPWGHPRRPAYQRSRCNGAGVLRGTPRPFGPRHALLERPRPFFSDGANGDRAGRLSD